MEGKEESRKGRGTWRKRVEERREKREGKDKSSVRKKGRGVGKKGRDKGEEEKEWKAKRKVKKQRKIMINIKQKIGERGSQKKLK